eukprot:scaffold126270_cov22-Prasinocladus_malaysianus.AAC.1
MPYHQSLPYGYIVAASLTLVLVLIFAGSRPASARTNTSSRIAVITQPGTRVRIVASGRVPERVV